MAAGLRRWGEGHPQSVGLGVSTIEVDEVVVRRRGFVLGPASLTVDAGQVVETAPPAQFFSAPESARARQFLARFHGQGTAA